MLWAGSLNLRVRPSVPGSWAVYECWVRQIPTLIRSIRVAREGLGTGLSGHDSCSQEAI